MHNFIEIHVNGQPRLVNTNWIEEIRDDGEQAIIFFAFQDNCSIEADFIRTDESYNRVVTLVHERW